MINFEKNPVKQRAIRDFILTSALCMAATTAVAQTQTSATPKDDVAQDKHKMSLTHNVEAGFDDLSALIINENSTTFYNDFQAHFNASIEDDRGHKASISALQLLIYDGNKTSPVLTKLMAEFDKKFKDGGELFLKFGRETTQGSDVFPNAIDYMADNYDVVTFGNGAELAVLGYRKDGNTIELGTIRDNGTGSFVLIPNMKESDFWGKGTLSLLQKSGVKIELEGAARLGKHAKLGLVGATVTKGGFGAKALVSHDFDNNDTKSLVRVYQNLKKGSKVIGELVHAGKGKGLDLRLGLGYKGIQVFTEYDTGNKSAQIGTSYFFGYNKTISKTNPQL